MSPARPRSSEVARELRALQAENEALRSQLQEAQEVLRAIRAGEVDALVVAGPAGDQVYTLRSAERPYRELVEQMQEGAAMLAPDGTIHYANHAFAGLFCRRLAETRSVQLRAVLAEMVQVEQRERERTAMVLHDHLQPLLVAARMKLGMLDPTEPVPAWETHRTQVEQLITECVDMSRSLSLGLNPPVLRDRGLSAALAWLAGWMKDKHNLEVALALQRTREPVDETLRVLCFQAVRELLLNVVKHAAVSRAEVRLSRPTPDTVTVVVADCGAGFDYAAWQSEKPGSRSVGLWNIQRRLTMMGVRFEFTSAPGQGTVATLHVPLTAPAPRAKPSTVAAARPRVARIPKPTEGKPKPPGAGGKRRPIRVLLVDDHQILRNSLGQALRMQPDLELVGEAENGHMAVQMAEQLQPDVVLMDISMPQLDGIEATRRISAVQPNVRIIGLSMYEKADKAQAMRAAGAVAYVPKAGAIQTLLRHIRAGRAKLA